MRQQRKRITPKERQHVYALCDGHCAYCGKEITIREMQVDHYLSVETGPAIADGKGDIDSIDNYLPACRSCNYRKSMMHVDQFRANVSRLHQVLMRDSVTYRDAVRFGQVTPNEHVQEFYFEKIGVKIPAMEWDADFRCMMQRMAKRSSERREDNT
ncbi:MAG: HNH endonuclease [Clostridia bacterium]|nr:HNH endonuclease [Clostridia bacterium]